MEISKLKRLMVIGAHPDDCESASGVALKLKNLGWRGRFLCATNGAAGHQNMQGAALALRRQEEARKVSSLTGIENEILDIEDGSLTANLPERAMMMRSIRLFSPNVIITHRPWDYHPDYRNTSIQSKASHLTRIETDAVVSCYTRPNTVFLDEMRAASTPVVNGGDSDKVRNLHHAILAGTTFGKDVDTSALVNPNHSPVNDLPLEIAAQFQL